MPAQKLVHSPWIIVYSFTFVVFLLFFLYPIPHTLYPTFAQGAAECQYEETREDGVYVCDGVLPGPAEAERATCVPDPSVDPNCQLKKEPAPPDPGSPITTTDQATTATGSLTGAGGEQITQKNYRAPQNANYTILNLEHSIFCELAGTSPVDKCIGLGKDKKISLYDQVPGGGALGGLTTFMIAMYQPPTSTAQYLAHLGENLGFVKPAYAQVGGSGAGIIEPIRALWLVTRNLAYIAFIIVFIVVGFMIMFRARINPQTVIGIQQALPGLILGLILVTFSYFIAALLIDLAFVGIQVVGQIFLRAGNNALDTEALARSSNVFNLFVSTIRPENIPEVAGGVVGTLFSAGGGGAGGAAVFLIPAVIGGIVGTVLAPGVGTAIGVLGGAAAPAILGLIVPLILILAIIIQFFRLLFGLITSYISLLVTTIVGPFIILFASIPGRSGVLGLWWKSLLGNALVFPAVFAAFMFAGLILGLDPKAFNASPPLFGGLSTELLRLILAYGIILGTPAIPGMVRRAIGVPELGGIPQAAIGGFMVGAQAGGAIAGPAGRGAAGAGARLLRGPAAAAPGGAMERFRERLERWSQPPRRP